MSERGVTVLRDDTLKPSLKITPKFFEIWKVLLEAWLRRQDPLSIQDLKSRVGCSDSTLDSALQELSLRGEIERTTVLHERFPTERVNLALHAADGLRAVLDDASVLEKAHITTSVSLLRGLDVTPDKLRITGARLIGDILDPFRDLAASAEHR